MGDSLCFNEDTMTQVQGYYAEKIDAGVLVTYTVLCVKKVFRLEIKFTNSLFLL